MLWDDDEEARLLVVHSVIHAMRAWTRGTSDVSLAGIRSLVYVVQLSISGCIAT